MRFPEFRDERAENRFHFSLGVCRTMAMCSEQVGKRGENRSDIRSMVVPCDAYPGDFWPLSLPRSSIRHSPTDS